MALGSSEILYHCLGLVDGHPVLYSSTVNETFKANKLVVLSASICFYSIILLGVLLPIPHPKWDTCTMQFIPQHSVRPLLIFALYIL